MKNENSNSPNNLPPRNPAGSHDESNREASPHAGEPVADSHRPEPKRTSGGSRAKRLLKKLFPGKKPDHPCAPQSDDNPQSAIANPQLEAPQLESPQSGAPLERVANPQ